AGLRDQTEPQQAPRREILRVATVGMAARVLEAAPLEAFGALEVALRQVPLGGVEERVGVPADRVLRLRDREGALQERRRRQVVPGIREALAEVERSSEADPHRERLPRRERAIDERQRRARLGHGLVQAPALAGVDREAVERPRLGIEVAGKTAARGRFLEQALSL